MEWTGHSAEPRWARVSDPAPGPTAGILNCVSIQLGVVDGGHSDTGRPSVGLCGSVGDRPQRGETGHSALGSETGHSAETGQDYLRFHS